MYPININFCDIKDGLELASYIVTILSLILGFVIYFNNKIVEKKNQKQRIFETVDEWYMNFLKVSYDNIINAKPYYYKYLKDSEIKNVDNKKIKQIIYFEMITSIMERTYLILKQHKNIDIKIHNGWKNYMKEWCKVSEYKKYWKFVGEQWDEDFAKFMNSNIK
ncbi:MAG: hypothetical protein NW207_06390 [Cytophagales bacterium]|nr:hypothetical protein [Cytophagales bacterium]